MIDATNIIEYTNEDLEAGINVIVRQIKAANFDPDFIVGLARGGAIPAVYLSHKLKKPIHITHWSSRDCHLAGGNRIDEWIPDDINLGTKVLLVDDIVDGGDTIRELLAGWGDSVRRRLCTENIKIASLVYNSGQETKVDFYDVILNRSDDPRWVQFPWEV